MGLIRKKKSSAGKRKVSKKTNFSVLVGNAHHIGMRECQQDSFCISDLSNEELCKSRGILAVIADGMGGMADGFEAATIVSRSMLQYFNEIESSGKPEHDLLNMVIAANNNVNRFMSSREQGGSTVVAVIILNDNLYWISVGDSRIYLARNGTLSQLNREHIYAADLDEMAAKGEVSWEYAAADPNRAALTSYIGAKELDKIDRNLRPLQLVYGDRVLLVSDGIFNALTDNEIQTTMSQPPQENAVQLMKMTLDKQNPNQDNLTAVVLEYRGAS